MMKPLTGLIGREELVEKIAREARKGRHLLLVGPVGIGKSAVLAAAIDRLLVRQARVVLHLHDHQAKGQFLELARGLLEAGLLKPSALELDPALDALDPAALEWTKLRRAVNRLSIRDLDFTPVLLVSLASVVGARYLAIGTGDTALYVFAGMLAAVVLSVRVFLVRGAGKAN